MVSLLEGLNPAEFEFEENDFMIDHFNKCMKSRFFDEFPISKRFPVKSVKYLYISLRINFINKII